MVLMRLCVLVPMKAGKDLSDWESFDSAIVSVEEERELKA